MTRPVLQAWHRSDQAECSHPTMGFVVLRQSNNLEQVRKVCLTCGYGNHQALPHRGHPNRGSYPILEHHPYPCSCHESNVQRLARALEQAPRPTYNEYLNSRQWRERREYAIRRALGRCQVCNIEASYLHVHHRTYERLGAEYDADLLVLCRECHELFHAHIGGATRREAA